MTAVGHISVFITEENPAFSTRTVYSDFKEMYADLTRLFRQAIKPMIIEVSVVDTQGTEKMSIRVGS